MADVEIGIGKSGRHAYGVDDIAIVSRGAAQRRTRRRSTCAWEIGRASASSCR